MIPELLISYQRVSKADQTLSYKPRDSAAIEGATGALSKQINMKSLVLKGRTRGQGF
jgi:hypothetical protein